MSDVEVVFTAEAIRARVNELGAELRREAGDTEIFLLGILKGSSCFLADLLRATPGPVAYGFVDVIRDVSDTVAADALRIDYLAYTNLSGRNVYVLKDVVTSGIIEEYLLTQFRQHKPSNLKLVALLDRPNLRTTDLKCDYRAFEVEAGTYVGYGLDLHERFGNLAAIGRVKR